MVVITHFFVEGSYQVYLYDKTNCTKSSYIINSNPVAYTTSTCHKTIVSCSMAINPDGILPNDCLDCYDASRAQDFEVLPSNYLGVDPITGLPTYERTIIDWENCHECTFTFDVVSDACDFTPTMDIQPLNGDALSYHYFFDRTDVYPYACGPATWLITNYDPAFSLTLTGDNVDHLFTSPGWYVAEMTVCYCICGEECCKTISMEFQVDRTVGGPAIMKKNPFEINSRAEVQVESQETNEDFIVVPNPVIDIFSIQSVSGDDYIFDEVTITDTNGQLIDVFNFISTNQDIDISSYSSGTYIIEGLFPTTRSGRPYEQLVAKIIIKQ